jgi:hypothetical protein
VDPDVGAGHRRSRDMHNPIGKWVKPAHERAIGWERKDVYDTRRVWWVGGPEEQIYGIVE